MWLWFEMEHFDKLLDDSEILIRYFINNDDFKQEYQYNIQLLLIF